MYAVHNCGGLCPKASINTGLMAASRLHVGGGALGVEMVHRGICICKGKIVASHIARSSQTIFRLAGTSQILEVVVRKTLTATVSDFNTLWIHDEQNARTAIPRTS